MLDSIIAEQQRLRNYLESMVGNYSDDEVYDIKAYGIRGREDYKLNENDDIKSIDSIEFGMNDLNWNHIANAIEHLLYNKVASSFMVLINK